MDINSFRENILLSCPWIDHNMRGIGTFMKQVHKLICYLDRDIEIVECGNIALGIDEPYNVRMLNAQHSHIRAAPVGSLLDRICGLGDLALAA